MRSCEGKTRRFEDESVLGKRSPTSELTDHSEDLQAMILATWHSLTKHYFYQANKKDIEAMKKTVFKKPMSIDITPKRIKRTGSYDSAETASSLGESIKSPEKEGKFEASFKIVKDYLRKFEKAV